MKVSGIECETRRWTCLVLTSESSSLHKSFLTSFSRRDLTTPNWKLLSWKFPHAFGIPVQWNPPCLQNSSPMNPPPCPCPCRRNPPSPSEFRDAARGIGMDIFWNHPMHWYYWSLVEIKGLSTLFIHYQLLLNQWGVDSKWVFNKRTSHPRLKSWTWKVWPFKP